jgi:hypothetical protein
MLNLFMHFWGVINKIVKITFAGPRIVSEIASESNPCVDIRLLKVLFCFGCDLPFFEFFSPRAWVRVIPKEVLILTSLSKPRMSTNSFLKILECLGLVAFRIVCSLIALKNIIWS